MKKVNNWINFILGLLANWYGYFLLLMIFIGMFGAMTNEYIKFSLYITSTETIQLILMAILLVIAGDYLTTNSVDKEEV